MAQKTGALEFEAEALAERGAGETVNGTARILVIENEGIGEKPLDRARIDVGLVRHVTTLAQPAPITDQQMGILVLHTRITFVLPGSRCSVTERLAGR